MEQEQLSEQIIKGDREAQFELFNKLSGKLLGVIVRYAENKNEAEEILSKGFVRMLNNFHEFNSFIDFEEKVKRFMIFVTIACLNIKENKNVDFYGTLETKKENVCLKYLQNVSISDCINILNRIDLIPRVVFNMYAIDGYSHKEIAEALNISNLTSEQYYQIAEKKLEILINDYARSGKY